MELLEDSQNIPEYFTVSGYDEVHPGALQYSSLWVKFQENVGFIDPRP